MKVIINSKETETESKNLSDLAQEMSLPKSGVAMAVDNTIVPRDEWDVFQLTEGVSVLIIKAACGG